MKLTLSSLAVVTLLGSWLVAVAPGCSTDSDDAPTEGSTSGEGVCADKCLKDCAQDSDCNTSDGELCCDFGDGSACVDAKDCPRFCGGDGDCDVADGEACLRVTLAAPESVCTEPDDAVRLCKSDATCDDDEVCCDIYEEPVCLKADRCPQACERSSDCDTDSGEVCCTTLNQQDKTLAADGLCIDPEVTACPTACERSSDCDTKSGEICCNGLCAETCEQGCQASSDCDGQVCCRTAAAKSPWVRDLDEPGYQVPMPSGGTGGAGNTGGTGAGGTGNQGGTGDQGGTGAGGKPNNGGTGGTGGCSTCGQAVQNGDFSGERVCAGTSRTLLSELSSCVCVTSCSTPCADLCSLDTRDTTCDACIASSCSAAYGACLADGSGD